MGAFQGVWHINLHISPTLALFASLFLQWSLFILRTPKHKNPQFNALAGQLQHMAAQKVGFTPRLLRQVAITGMFQAQLHWDLHIRPELETYQLWPPALGACENHTHFGPQITPSVTIPSCDCNCLPAKAAHLAQQYQIQIGASIQAESTDAKHLQSIRLVDCTCTGSWKVGLWEWASFKLQTLSWPVLSGRLLFCPSSIRSHVVMFIMCE